MESLSLKKLDAIAVSVTDLELDQSYYRFHRKRYLHLLNTIQKLSAKYPIQTVLDIGASFQTRLLDATRDGFVIDTLGFTIERFIPVKNETKDTFFDLTQCGEDETGLEGIRGKYDLIILAEVIEHMRIRPERVMNTLRSLLKPGGLLIIQTPNAAFIGSRIKLLLGKNPMPWIRDEVNNPGHFREYTKKELIHLAASTDYQLLSIVGKNYFSHQSPAKQLALTVTAILPGTFKNGFTMVVQKN